MFIELHVIQNFAPSNLNRSDTGAPKDCEFGGVRRARISSQCFKRAMREYFKTDSAFTSAHEANLAHRTKRLVDEITGRLTEAGKPEEEARKVVEAALNGVKLTVKEDAKTQYLLFLGKNEIAAIANLGLEHYDQLLSSSEAQAGEKGKGTAKQAKKAGKEAVPKEIRDAFENVLNGGKAADLALFGRMLADLPHKNVDAASQVAHAISTHKSGVEFDFYTAIDDLRPEDTQGSDMLGTVEFNSACFYRYANVDVEQLKKNLDDDEELACATIEAFIRAATNAVPTGKQNSMAAQNPPSFVLAIARDAGLWSLANAFVKPVKATANGDLVETSINALGEYWKQLTTAYGEKQIKKCYINLSGKELEQLNGSRVKSIDELIEKVRSTIKFNGANGQEG